MSRYSGGPPLRPVGPLGDLLRRELRPGEEASVLSQVHKDGTEIDADLFQKGSDGLVRRIDRVHLDPRTLVER